MWYDPIIEALQDYKQVHANLAKLDAKIAVLKALGADPANPVPQA